MTTSGGTRSRAGLLLRLLLCGGAAIVSWQCYSLRGNAGGADTREPASRTFDAAAIAVPAGYRVELVASGLTFPTGIAFDDEGQPHVVEAGYCYGEVWTTPRLLRVEDGGAVHVVSEGATESAPWNGVAFHDGAFVVVAGGTLSGGRVLRIDPGDGAQSVLVSGLPTFGDHHANGPAIGPDGSIIIGIGTATNSGVVGEDNAAFGWLGRRPDFHDVPGQDVVLRGATFRTEDALAPGGETVETGAFSPFGTTTRPGQVVAGAVACSGSVLEVDATDGSLELVAWGFRNPFGLAFAPDGTLYVTDNGYDDRGSRPVWGSADHLWAVQRGVWYGWPDWSGEHPLTHEAFTPPGGEALTFLLEEHPGRPPKPAAILGVHCAAAGLDFSRSARFGHVGDAFVALFGDQTPATGKLLAPVGFEVVRVEREGGIVHPFAANAGARVEPASRNGGRGLERPIAVRFDPSGESLYVVDFGVLTEQEDGAHPVERSGCLWRIRRGTDAAAAGRVSDARRGPGGAR